MNRRTAFMTATLILASVLASSNIAAQAYPGRTIRLLVGGATGSVPDTLARPIAERLSSALGQTVVVENRPGAAGIIAMEAMVKSAPDGYTIALATMSQAVFNNYLFSKLPYDPLRDLQPVAPLVTGAMVLAAHPSFPASSLSEVAMLTKAQPGRIFVAMPQNGSPPHVVALLLNRAAGLNVTMVAHKSGSDAVTAVLSGDIPLIIDAPTILAPQIAAGKLRAIAVTGSQREPSLPNVPTVAESGFASVRGEAWIGIVAPHGTPAAIIQRLNKTLNSIMATPEMQALMATLSFRTLTATPEEFQTRIRDDHALWSTIIREAGIKLD